MSDPDAVEKQLEADLETIRAYRELEARLTSRTAPRRPKLTSLPSAGPLEPDQGPETE
jgi:hypothetical protein